jgi:hypothetical protein
MTTAFDKFERFGKKTYQAQDVLKNHILEKFPVHYTTDVEDYSVVKQYADKHEFVWLVEEGIQTLNSFPWFFRPSSDQKDSIHLFPYIYKSSKRIKSWKKVQLVPTRIVTDKKTTHNHICGIYDFYQGKTVFDIFYIGEETQQYKDLAKRFKNIQCVSSYEQARRLSETDMFWVVPDDVEVSTIFKFSYQPDDWSHKFTHVFVNGNSHRDGIILAPKSYEPSAKELKYRYFANKKEMQIVASYPKQYPMYHFKNYEEYATAIETEQSDLFWWVPDDVIVENSLVFNTYFEHRNQYDRTTNHVFLNDTAYDGIALFSKHSPVTEKEFNHRFYTNKKEHEVLASRPKKFEQFVVNNYADYKLAKQRSKTDMFWCVPTDIIVDFNFETYFTHHNQYDRNITHVFLNNDIYDGVALFSKNVDITENEFEHRFYVNKKEWPIVASIPKPYDVFEIDSYVEYLNAVENSTTELFWMSSRNITPNNDLLSTYYINHHQTQDKSKTHAFVHQVQNETLYNGLFLCNKRNLLSEREVEYRFPAERIEHDIIGSAGVNYNVFEIDSYDEYLNAVENSTTEMFWMSSANITADIPNLYFTHDNEYDRKQNHNFLHHNNKRNGLFLCSKHAFLTQKEVEHRHFVNAKEWDIVASGPKSYDVFEIDNYDEYLEALENSTTEMFWMSSRNITAEIPDLYFTHDNEYDRKQNHNFLHCGKRNGLFLCSKYVPLTQKEVEHRHLVNAKEWDIVGSTPKTYDVFEIDSYDEYLDALKNSVTEMFWMSSRNITAEIPDLYFTHENEYDRKQNHNFLHCGKRNGVFLCSKHIPLTQKEVEYRHLVNAKEWDVVASRQQKYNIFTINNYNDYVAALEKSTTEMFYGVPDDVDINFNFDLYFTHDNEYDRTVNHVLLNGEHRDGIVLFSKHAPATQKEVENRFYINKKDWNIVASNPKRYETFVVETYDNYLDAIENSTTDMFWATTHNIRTVKDFDFDMYFSHHNTYDRNINHTFVHRVDNIDYHNGLFLLSKHALLTQKEIEHRLVTKRKEHSILASGPAVYDQFVIDTYNDYEFALRTSKTEMFWMIPPEVNVDPNFKFDLYFTHNQWFDRETNHVFKNGTAWDGISLVSKKTLITEREINMRFLANKKQYDITASTPNLYDIVFISKDEEHADVNYNNLLTRFPRAKRVHGVNGIHQAHIEAAKLCTTDMFWVVDADAEIIDKFTFDYYVPAYDPDSKKTVHVWKSQNPINGLVYGYGAVKLLPRNLTVNMNTDTADMTTSISKMFKSINRISNITQFNTDEFSTWRSAFRETVKLSSRTINGQLDEETEFRLNVWCTRGATKPFGEYCISGAILGREYGERNKENTEALRKINDFNWLEKQFKKSFPQV